MRRLIKAGTMLAAVTLAGALAACSAGAGSGGSGGGTAAKTATLTISNENGALWTCDFSPFNGSDTLLSVGLVYETLDYVNPLQDGKVTPMLASAYSWGAGDKSLVLVFFLVSSSNISSAHSRLPSLSLSCTHKMSGTISRRWKEPKDRLFILSHSALSRA